LSQRSEKLISKTKVEVEVRLNDGTEMLGFLFVITNQQRISDLLNDGRRFLPFLGSDGLMHFLRTEAIATVSEVQQEVNLSVVVDPYQVLGVPANISDDALAKVYHDLCRQFHPDRMSQYELPKELVASASTMTVRIIDAYNRIKKTRGLTVRVN
jgi:DnaJ-domain-containing protein 1